MFGQNIIYEKDGRVNLTRVAEHANYTIKNYLSTHNINNLSLAIIYIMEEDGVDMKHTLDTMKELIESYGINVTIYTFDNDTAIDIIVHTIEECNIHYTGIYIVDLEHSCYDIKYFRNIIDKDKCVDGLHYKNISDIMFYDRDECDLYSFVTPINVFLIRNILDTMDDDGHIGLCRSSNILLLDDEDNSSYYEMNILGMHLIREFNMFISYYRYSSYNNTDLEEYLQKADIIIVGGNFKNKTISHDIIYDKYNEKRLRLIIDLGNSFGEYSIDYNNMKKENLKLYEEGNYYPIQFVTPEDMNNLHLVSYCIINNLIILHNNSK